MENEEHVVGEHITSEINNKSEHYQSSETDNKSEHYQSSETIEELDESSEIANMKKVEAALFLSARFLKLKDLVMLTDINPLMIRELIEKLIEKYNSDKSAIEIVVKEDMWKMDIGEEYVSMVNKLATGSAEFTKAEQETLAVIAYKQPVKQSIIIKIRGNKAYEHIKHFIEIGLVQSKKAGRTKELRLSDDFYEYFHLQKKGDGTTDLVINGGDEVVVDSVEDVGEMEEENSSDNDSDNVNEEISEGEVKKSGNFEDNIEEEENMEKKESKKEEEREGESQEE